MLNFLRFLLILFLKKKIEKVIKSLIASVTFPLFLSPTRWETSERNAYACVSFNWVARRVGEGGGGGVFDVTLPLILNSSPPNQRARNFYVNPQPSVSTRDSAHRLVPGTP